jgi:hypothetical protein
MGAHESSIDFAQLLLSPSFRQTHTYELWKDVFPLLYNGSVEEVAQRADEWTLMLQGGM